MRTLQFLAVVLHFATLTWPLPALSESRYFVVTLGRGAEVIGGYARIEHSTDGRATGKLCAYSTGDVQKFLGTLTIAGTISSGTMTLTLRPDVRTSARMRSRPFRNEPVVLTENGRGREYGELLGVKQWEWVNSPDPEITLILNEFSFSEEVDTTTQDDTQDDPHTYANLAALDDYGNNKRFELAQFDGLTPKQAFSLIIRTQLEEVIAPTVVLLVYRPQDRRKIESFLKKYSGLARFRGPPLPNCGVPLLESSIRVSAGLEFYFARMLQKSGMVVSAFPLRLPRSPSFIAMPVKSSKLLGFISGSSELDAADRAIGRFLDAQLRDFLSAKRPGFKLWEISSRSGSRFAYRWQVVGASVSSCDANLWEKFEIQMSLTLGPQLVLQAVDGFEAPGQLSRRPSDTRFRDNRLGDDRLSSIQDAFYDFLIRKGVSDDTALSENQSSENQNSSAACSL